MEINHQKFDVAIIGAGIAGSSLGAILARQGLKVVLFESKSHPRFAIGESMILETSETLRAMAELYDVPELAYFSSEYYFSHIGTSHGVKRHFSYLYHNQGYEHNIQECFQAVIPKQPYGHELHLHRQDSDYFLTMTAIRYGVKVLQNTPVSNVDINSDGVEISTRNHQRFTADYVVDAGGFHSILAEKFNLRHQQLQTHSRAIFTHMINLPCYHQIEADREQYGIPFPLSEGTLHHVFSGGWLWIIPFNNHANSTNPLCSVGLMLDPRQYPVQTNLTPEEEFYCFIENFPSIHKQLQQAKPVRDWTRTDRIQYSSKKVVGRRYCLLGHAAGFIDPLFSKGLYTSTTCASVLANLLIEAWQTQNYAAEKFQALETLTLNFIQSNDQLVAHAYKSFSNYKTWSLYIVLWLLGAYSELLKLTMIRAKSKTRSQYYAQLQQLKLVGGGFLEFDGLQQQVHGILDQFDLDSTLGIDQAVLEIRNLYRQTRWMPHQFQEILRGKNHLPASKIRLTLLKKHGGFLGSGIYRTHFFGRSSLWSIVKLFFKEKLKYSLVRILFKRKLKGFES
ncbi:MAG: NAD(P)/FAD-dependent oxidoreductase [Microcoleaceae cyanobacterium]